MYQLATLISRSFSEYHRVGIVARRFRRCPRRLFSHRSSTAFPAVEECGTEEPSERVAGDNVGLLAAGGIDLSYPAYTIWGSNTGVGKTLLSAGLVGSILSSGIERSRDVLYLKPVQTGFPKDSDARFVYREVSSMLRSNSNGLVNNVYISKQTVKASPAVHKAVRSKDAAGMEVIGTYEELILEGSRRPNFFINSDERLTASSRERHQGGSASERISQLMCRTLLAWFDPVSPHYAAEMEGTVVEDSDVIQSILSSLKTCTRNNLLQRSPLKAGEQNESEKWAIVETAGGVASPGPSGTLQCDLYRPLRLPCVLMGDGRLGGISSTISAYETLHLRGYDVEAVVLLDAGLANEMFLEKYLQGRTPVFVLPPVPEDTSESLSNWFIQSQHCFSRLRCTLEEANMRRLQRLQEMPSKAEQILWWPFTQHTMVPTGDVTVIDSRCAENFSVFKNTDGGKLEPQFDACASWWTQGPDSRLQPELAKAAGYAAGRYGHVMFPENVHEPALRCAELLLELMGKGWGNRVYFSDNGSTAVEIALKMAFRKFVTDHKTFLGSAATSSDLESQRSLKVLALNGSYHGDTLGAMEAQAPSPYTGFLQQPWYSGRGLFLDSPKVYLRNGQWQLQCPHSLLRDSCTEAYDADTMFESRADVFSSVRDHTPWADICRAYVRRQLQVHETSGDRSVIGALIIEPVIHGAGGMDMVDPLFQRILVSECRLRNIPVIFDEILAGCWRLGVKSTSELLHCYPDIACYSKLLTGGTVPLAATIATEEIFEAFKGQSKLDALLHGHSYTAHAMGCATAVATLQHFSDPVKNSNLTTDGRLQELWCPELVSAISCHTSVRRVVSLGTLFACELEDKESGYTSTSTKGLIQMLRADGIYTRPLGNVVYLMCGPLTSPASCTSLLEVLLRNLDQMV
ncbi:hypothetical protein R1sor_003012 [Riccia sorocarpa]|uniref:Uncharacterized protein n=1 Tax=Riccia sorocarpa TaxID=122646 RepID=A0ABD3H0C4_9MARC